jgi:pyruvate dehydrogenase E1 component beta subunit
VKEVTFAESINMALNEAMEINDQLFLIGEDIGKLGGVFRVTSGLQSKFGEKRVIDSPLSETGIVGMAYGMVLNGLSVVVEIQFDGFLYMCFNQIASYLSRASEKFKRKLPLLIRVPYGGGIGAVPYHEESPEALCLNLPGLNVIMISDSRESRAAIVDTLEIGRPTVLFESKKNYWKKSSLAYEGQIQEPRLLMSGKDYTIFTYGAIADHVVEVADFLNKRLSLSCDIFKLVQLSDFNREAVYDSVEKTGSVVIIHESYRFMGYCAELASELYERYNKRLRLPILRIGSFKRAYPASAYYKEFLPSKERIILELSTFLRQLLAL